MLTGINHVIRKLFPVVIYIVPFLMGCSGHSRQASYKEDLRNFGLKVHAPNSVYVSYNQLSFLSNDLLLVTINQREFTELIQPADVDTPPARLLLFDLTKRILSRSTERVVEKDANSVQPLSNTRFAIRNESGLQICDTEFVCSRPIAVPGRGPLVSSPGGTSFIAGGYGETSQVLFDSSSLNELGHFARRNPTVVPGDGVILLRYSKTRQLSLKEGAEPERALPFTDAGVIFLPDSRFLATNMLAINDAPETLLVIQTNGKPLYHVPVVSWDQGTAIVTSATGARFGIRDSNYTLWNSITHFYDVDKTRPYDFERIRVLRAETGETIFELARDPRPYISELTLPALSPDGHHLATIHNGYLEVYDIP